MGWTRVPLVWRNLTHHWRRLAVALCGIGFAVVLMFTETGFQNALFDSTVKVLDDLDADLIVVSEAHYALLSKETFSHHRIRQARACPGVKGVYPLYLEIYDARWKNPNCVGIPIRILAFHPADPVFKSAGILACATALTGPYTAAIDAKCKSKYEFPRSRDDLLQIQDAELCGHAVRVVGSFEMGADFVVDGNTLVSAANLARLCPLRALGDDPLSAVDLGIVQLENPAESGKVQEKLRALLPKDIEIYTKREFMDRETGFWSNSTPIGYVFFLGVVIGFLVGVIVCYQVIYSDISDHMAEFATLKAMGYRNRYFMGFVLSQSLYLSALSFAPGLLVSMLLYALLERLTGLLMLLTLPRAALVFFLTMVMCSVSGVLAMRKVLAADPAELF